MACMASAPSSCWRAPGLAPPPPHPCARRPEQGHAALAKAMRLRAAASAVKETCKCSEPLPHANSSEHQPFKQLSTQQFSWLRGRHCEIRRPSTFTQKRAQHVCK
eukprot:17438-Pelagomonas_calceolata.AAC.4